MKNKDVFLKALNTTLKLRYNSKLNLTSAARLNGDKQQMKISFLTVYCPHHEKDPLIILEKTKMNDSVGEFNAISYHVTIPTAALKIS